MKRYIFGWRIQPKYGIQKLGVKEQKDFEHASSICLNNILKNQVLSKQHRWNMQNNNSQLSKCLLDTVR